MSRPDPTRLDFAAGIDFSSILTNPILDIAARFWEADRYEAFRVFYRSMRRIDDLVDDLKTELGAVPAGIAERAASEIDRWLEAVRRRECADEFQSQFIATLDRFVMPLWPWDRLGQAMKYDLEHRGFTTLHAFLRYAEGAAISPAAVFMHLSGVRKDGDRFLPPSYDIRQAARPLAIFSYLVHIIRDFEKDQRAGLNYFTDELVARAGLTTQELNEYAVRGTTDSRVRNLMREYHRIAVRYRRLARTSVNRTLPYLDDRYQLGLETIYSLYNQIFELIDPDKGSFTGEALAPSTKAMQERIELLISQFRPVPRVPVTNDPANN